MGEESVNPRVMNLVWICSFCSICSLLATGAEPEDPKLASRGVLPVGANGRPMNLDLEAGSLLDWQTTGEAFDGQPVRGNAIKARKPGEESGRSGLYWIGTYEVEKSDRSTGILQILAQFV